MPPAEIEFPTVSQRLARLGLAEREKQLRNLNVKSGAEVVITLADRRHAPHIATLHAQAASELKRWVGVPFGALGQASSVPANKATFVSTSEGHPFLPFPAVPLDDLEMQGHLMSYLLSTTAPALQTRAEKALMNRLDQVVRHLDISVVVYLAKDIHVEEGATLVIGPKVHTLFGNHIIVENDATIRMEAPVARIDCARLRFVQS